MNIEETITALGDINTPLLNSSLAELSNLSPAEIGLFEQIWAEIEPKQRHQIVYRLVELARDNVEFNFDSIFKNCLKNDNADVRGEAIEGLWENEEASLIESLIDLLEQDSSDEVQATAATALGKFAMLAEHRKLRPHYKGRLAEVLLAAIGDETKPIEVRRRALESAAPLSLPEVREAIITAHQSNIASLRVGAIYAMGKSCDPSWLSILLEELSNVDAEIRYEAVGACGELEEEESVPHIIELVNDPDIDVQLAAIQTLGKIGGAEAKECLKQCLDNTSEAICQAAEQALQELEAGEDPLSFRI